MSLALAPSPTALVIRDLKRKSSLSKAVEAWTPQTALGALVRRALPSLSPDLAQELFDAIRRSVVVESSLRVKVLRNLGLAQRGLIPWSEVVEEDYGVVSRKVVTDVGVGYIVDAFQNLVEMETMKYHGLGTGTTNEAAGDTALVTELTTEYTGNVRATGTTTETSANVYQTVGTNTLDSGTPAITEHGVFSASSSGVLFDRSKFAAINLTGANGDGLTSTYSATFASGG